MTTTTQTDMTVKELRTEAATLGIKGRSKMSKAQLLDALEAWDAKTASAAPPLTDADWPTCDACGASLRSDQICPDCGQVRDVRKAPSTSQVLKAANRRTMDSQMAATRRSRQAMDTSTAPVATGGYADAKIEDAYEVADIVEPGASDSSPAAALVRSLQAATAQLQALATIPAMAADVAAMASRLLRTAEAM